MPPLDNTDNLITKSVQSQDGITKMMFTRKLDTSDEQDITLTGCIYLLWAYGDAFSDEILLYHSSSRGVASNIVCFPEPDVCPPGMYCIHSYYIIVFCFSCMLCVEMCIGYCESSNGVAAYNY